MLQEYSQLTHRVTTDAPEDLPGLLHQLDPGHVRPELAVVGPAGEERDEGPRPKLRLEDPDDPGLVAARPVVLHGHPRHNEEVGSGEMKACDEQNSDHVIISTHNFDSIPPEDAAINPRAARLAQPSTIMWSSVPGSRSME